jgi:AraC family transcriptional regulator, regulatory protein of adaptative response / DNA-3-methyladenine glycosylase II
MDGVAGLSESTLDRARISRDPRFDGKFFIAVRTTGIYCRPICPSPRSNKVNVRYYATAAAAAAAGYRPCRRCRPEVAPGSPAWLGPSAVVRRALRLIQEGSLDTGTVESLATRLGIGSRHLDRLFVQHLGVSPVAVAQTRRLHFAKQLLDETDLRVIDIAMAAGFRSIRRFNDAFLNAFGEPPSELRRRPTMKAGTRRSESIELRLVYRPPYDWDHLVSFLARSAIAGVERVDAHGYARTLAVANGHVIVSVRPRPGETALSLRVTGATPATLFELATVAKRVFDISADPVPIAEVLALDPILRPLLETRPALRVPGEWNPFECAVRAVLAERVTVATSRAWVEGLVNRIGTPIVSGVEGLTHLFPSPLAILERGKDELALPKSRVATLISLAQAVHERRIDFTAPSDEVMRALASVPGIGRWGAQYVALRALGEPDAFPAGDPVLRRMIVGDERRSASRDVEARAEAWRPWRAYAVIHLWEAAGPTKNARVSDRRPRAPSSLTLRPAAPASLRIVTR